MDASKGTVLIVDDETTFRKKYRKLLQDNKYEVHEASDALAVANSLMREGSGLDLVLLDINIAEVDGREIFDIISDYSHRIKVIVTSVFPEKEQKLRIPKAHDFFSKADKDAVLLEKINNLIGF